IETPIKTPMEMPAEIRAVAQVAQATIPGPSVAPPLAPMAFDHAAPSVASVFPVHQEVALVHEAPETKSAPWHGTGTQARVSDNDRSGNAAALPEAVDFARIPLDQVDALIRQAADLVVVRTAIEQRVAELARYADELRVSGGRLKRIAAREHEGNAGQALPGGELPETVSQTIAIQQQLGALTDKIAGYLSRQKTLFREMQDGVMRMRMTPFAGIVPWLQAAFADLAARQGKQARLAVRGGETEIDKVTLDQLAGPVWQILANALIHGIEPDAQRAGNGKPPAGAVEIEVGHEGAQVLIRIRDDGQGMNPATLRARAVQLGFLSSTESGTTGHQELCDLIFSPGRVTQGASNGMDVVRNAVEKLRGEITVRTLFGQGTTFEIRLPLTQAMARVLLARAGEQTYAIPQAAIVRVLRVEKEQIYKIGQAQMLEMEGQFYTITHLSTILNSESAPWDGKTGAPALLVSVGGEQVVLIVDQLAGSREIALRHQGDEHHNVRGVLGMTTVEDGQAVLVLDLADLLRVRPEGDNGDEDFFESQDIPFGAGAGVIETDQEAELEPAAPPPGVAVMATEPGFIQPEPEVEPAQPLVVADVVNVFSLPVFEEAEMAAPADALADDVPDDVFDLGAPAIRRTVILPQEEELALLENIVAEIAAPVPETDSPFTDQAPPLVVMIVDDSAGVRRTASGLVTSHGWTPVEARDGLEALETLNQAPVPPDIILLDVEMPRMDGYELLVTLQASPVWREIPVIMVTSRSGERHQQKAIELGAAEYLVKPYQDEHLVRLITSLTEGRKVREARA
ncbi:MAG: response regulator, partial [Blastocatellia bacterium]